MTDIFFPEQGLCVTMRGFGELSVWELPNGVLRATYQAPRVIPIRVHRWGNTDAEELWFLSNEAKPSLSRVYVTGFPSLAAEEGIVFSGEARIVPAQDGLRILWEGWQRAKAAHRVPLSDPYTGRLEGVVAIEGSNGLQAVLVLRSWYRRCLMLYERGKRPVVFPEVGANGVEINGVEIARREQDVLLSVIEKREVRLFILPGWKSLLKFKAEPSDIICAAFPVPAGAWREMQKDGIGVILARSEKSEEGKPRAYFALRIFDIDERTVLEMQIGSVDASPDPQPYARVSPDRRFLVVESPYFRQVFRLPSE